MRLLKKGSICLSVYAHVFFKLGYQNVSEPQQSSIGQL